MQLSEALDLIRNEHLPPPAAAYWADLGCGAGLFTKALARLLPPGSTISAVDREPVVFQDPSLPQGIVVDTLQLDFVEDPLDFRDLDGVLMANSLHYVRDKAGLLRKLAACMKPGGHFLIVEYDIEIPVPQWVPYPLSFRALTALFQNAGYKTIEKLGEKPSSFGRGKLYGAWV